MGKQSAYLARIQRAQARRDEEVRHHTRVFELDMVTLARGRMGKRETFFREFDRTLAEVEKEYAAEILADAEDDPEVWYTKDRMDRELRQYVGGLFCPHDERYR